MKRHAVDPALAARGALAAASVGRHGDVHPLGEAKVVCGDAFQGRGDFMTGNARIGHQRVLAQKGAEVGPAQADAANAHGGFQRVVGLGGTFHIDDARLSRPVNHQSSHWVPLIPL